MIFVSQLRWLMGDLFKLQTCHSNVAIHSFLSWSEMLKEFCLCFELLVEQQKPTECGKMGQKKKSLNLMNDFCIASASPAVPVVGSGHDWSHLPPLLGAFLLQKKKRKIKSRSSSSDTGENVITLLVRLPDLVRGCWLEWQLGLMTWRLMDDFYQTLP